ncbi:MAG: ribbon-helix-helix protein, CopG family [Planctomycetes bacterium]|nr:ribbon-helix-helix protein, CopG family [Planctomycetota bacterium]
MVKTTLVIDDQVLVRLKQEATRQDRTISELVEAALRLFLEKRPKKERPPPLPRHRAGRPLVDLSDRDALYRVMDGR